MLVDVGFLRVGDVGVSGLTLGTSGKEDGVVTKVDAGSAADKAGLAVGDRVVAVNQVSATRTPGSIAVERTFGVKGAELHMTLLRDGKEIPVTLVRAAAKSPTGPKSPSMFIQVRSAVDWRGRFIPCMGIGPLGPGVIALCHSRFKPYGYITLGEFATTGMEVDVNRREVAVITGVDSDGPAAKANVHVGDEIVAVEGKPLTASSGEYANSLLFGKAGDVMHMTMRRGESEIKVDLTLAAKAKG